MFSKNSRYYQGRDNAVIDANGNTCKEKQLRLLPHAEGKHIHTLSEGGRLDHLADRYYKQTTRWWRICDADADSLSPLQLIGKESLSVARCTVHYIPAPENPAGDESIVAPVPPLGILIQTLLKKTGIVRVQTIMNVFCENNSPEIREWVIEVAYNNLNITREEIKSEIERREYQVPVITDIMRTGKKIFIPANIL